MNKYDIYNKAIKVIDSCETLEHFKCAERYCKFVAKKFEDLLLEADLIKKLSGTRFHVLKEGWMIVLPKEYNRL